MGGTGFCASVGKTSSDDEHHPLCDCSECRPKRAKYDGDNDPTRRTSRVK